MKKTITLLTILLFVVFMVGCENSINPTQPVTQNDNTGISLAKQAAPTTSEINASKGGKDKYIICHLTGNGKYVTISVDANALDAHLAHGDYLPLNIEGNWSWVGWDWLEMWDDWDWTDGPPKDSWTTSHTWVITQNGTSISGTGQHSGGLTWTFTGTIIGRTISLDAIFVTAVKWNFHLDGTIQSDGSIQGLFYYSPPNEPHPYQLPWQTISGKAVYNSCE